MFKKTIPFLLLLAIVTSCGTESSSPHNPSSYQESEEVRSTRAKVLTVLEKNEGTLIEKLKAARVSDSSIKKVKTAFAECKKNIQAYQARSKDDLLDYTDTELNKLQKEALQAAK